MSGSTLRKSLIYLGIVAVAFFVLDRALALGLQAILKQSEFRFSKVYQGGVDAEIITLGNSRAVNAFYSPEMEAVLDKSVFNLGYNGMSLEVVEAVFLDYLDNNAKPDLVILEITNLRSSNKLLKDLKLYGGLSRRIRELVNSNFSNIAKICEVTNIYRYNNEMFSDAYIISSVQTKLGLIEAK